MSMSVTAVNNTLPLPPPSGNPFDDILNAYFGGFDSPTYAATAAGKKQAIWLNFLQANNLASVTLTPSPQQDEELKLLRAFVKQTDIDVFQPIPPAAGQHGIGSIMNSLFGALSAGKQQEIWIKFLNLAPQSPPYDQTLVNTFNTQYPSGLLAAYNANALLDDAFTKQLFLTFIQNAVANNEINIVTYTNQVLTPEEIKKRNIMFLVLDSVISMLLSLQNTVTAQADSLAFFARWQKEYTKMLTRVPTYVGGEKSDVRTIDIINDPNPDWSKFTFGYGDISVEDIARWWAEHHNDVPFTAFTIQHNYVFPGNQQFDRFLDRHSTISVTASGITFTVRDGTGGFVFFPFAIPDVSTPITTGTDFDTNVTNFETAFKTFWNQASPWMGVISNDLNTTYNSLSSGAATGNGLTQIYTSTSGSSQAYAAMQLWKPYTYIAQSNFTDPSNPIRALSDAHAKARGEINARDQQYIENIRSKRQVVQDVQSEVQANLDQSRQTLTQQTDLFNSLIDSLKGLLSSIFR